MSNRYTWLHPSEETLPFSFKEFYSCKVYYVWDEVHQTTYSLKNIDYQGVSIFDMDEIYGMKNSLFGPVLQLQNLRC